MDCAVATCKNSWRKTKDNKDVVYHTFPKDPEFSKAWLIKCKRADKVNVFNARICSVHFKNDDYSRDLEHELLGLPPRKIRRLKLDAVPNLHLPECNGKSSTQTLQVIKPKRPLSNRSKNVNPGSLSAVDTTPDIQENAVIDEGQRKIIRRKRKTKGRRRKKRPKKEICPTISKPAKVDHVQDGSPDPCHMLEELPELYLLITLPHLEQEQLNLQWVYNIISGKEGQDRVVYESPCKDDKNGFVLIKDSRWDGVSVENLHLLALPYRPGLLSLRDLREGHLKLLQNIHNEGKGVIWRKYGVMPSQLHVFLEYQPSFYHLNVHFTVIREGTCDTRVGRAHLLYSVINNILMCPNYYQDASLPFYLKESDILFSEFEAHGLVRRVGNSR